MRPRDRRGAAPTTSRRATTRRAIRVTPIPGALTRADVISDRAAWMALALALIAGLSFVGVVAYRMASSQGMSGGVSAVVAVFVVGVAGTAGYMGLEAFRATRL